MNGTDAAVLKPHDVAGLLQNRRPRHPGLLTPLTIPFKLPVWNLSLGFVKTQIFIPPKSSVCNGAFRGGYL